MLGDTCTTCHQPTTTCTCPEGPCIPANDDGECEDWMNAACVFWKGSDIPNTPIKKNARMSEIILYLVSEINTLKSKVNALENP